MQIHFKTYSIKGNDRLTNSDYVHTKSLPGGWIGIVCDGVGESTGGDNTGKLCAFKIMDLVQKSSEPDSLKKMKSAIEETNRYLYSLRQSNSNNGQTATTLVVLYLLNHTACWGHVGDSRIYKLKNGRLNQLTKDHSVIQELVDGGYVTLKEAALHSGTNVIGRAMGEKPNVTADVSKMNLQPIDKNRFFLCTDGVTSILTDVEIENCLRKDTIEGCLSGFISLINRYDVADDASFIIVDGS
ncbi:MAG: protein phosphatase 2C domain-containing protein [Ignavibacteriaceae bacterium]